MKSYFVTGTDTDIGKTYVTAGLAWAIKKRGIDVGVMKPFAAGNKQISGFKSKDVEILANAAEVNDPEELLNPQFFSIPASPYTASLNTGETPKIDLVLSGFKKLSKIHEMILVEGMGGIMTPITKEYFVTDLIKEMNLDAIVVTRSKIGTVNHTILTLRICQDYSIPVKGIIINDFDSGGYPPAELKRDLESLTGVKVLGTIPKVEPFDHEKIGGAINDSIKLDSLF